jgi:IS30 family transposase
LKSYSQLTIYRRYQIRACLSAGYTQVEIASELGVHPSTISRELKRNRGMRGYRPDQAQSLADSRSFGNTNASKFSTSDWELVGKLLEMKYSLEQIANRTKLESTLSICHESIYRYIYEDKRNGGDLYTHLRCQKKRRKRYASGRNRRGTICDQVRIDKRPAVVEKRKRLGDLEGDTMIGKSHKGAIVTMVDRKSRLLYTGLSHTKEAPEVTSKILITLDGKKVKTITYDNGLEFSLHKEIAEKTNSKSYFAYPYHSWERGTNENTNGLLRQFFPKGTDFRSIDPKDLEAATENINNRPRKILGWKSPVEVHYKVKMTYTRMQ